jgi:phage terminase large subunit-like protein
MGKFRSIKDIAKMASKAVRMPDSENTFRNLFLNQRVSVISPFVSKLVWESCGADVAASFNGHPVYGGLDLSSTTDLTALVLVAQIDGVWHAKTTFWLPADTLQERAKTDRVPYDRWHREGYLDTTPGMTVEYKDISKYLRLVFDSLDVKQIAFDRWNYPRLKPWLVEEGFIEDELLRFAEFGQGYKSMSPAIRDLESVLLSQKLAHGNHPVLTMCAANTVVTKDAAGNRKFDKGKAYGRIDGMVSLVMAMSVALGDAEEPFRSRYEDGAAVITL